MSKFFEVLLKKMLLLKYFNVHLNFNLNCSTHAQMRFSENETFDISIMNGCIEVGNRGFLHTFNFKNGDS